MYGRGCAKPADERITPKRDLWTMASPFSARQRRPAVASHELGPRRWRWRGFPNWIERTSRHRLFLDRIDANPAQASRTARACSAFSESRIHPARWTRSRWHSMLQPLDCRPTLGIRPRTPGRPAGDMPRNYRDRSSHPAASHPRHSRNDPSRRHRRRGWRRKDP